MTDTFLTIARAASAETKIKGSKFMAEVNPVDSVDAAVSKLEEIRKSEHAATHHCYAYRVGMTDKPEFKYSDDGEPSGTAGKPIYDIIAGRELTNLLVVVTRYFGGTKLGTGGLVRAYGEAAQLALEKAETRNIYITDTISLEFEFTYFDLIQKLIQKYDATQESADFGESVKLTLSVRRSMTNNFKREIVDITNGRANIK